MTRKKHSGETARKFVEETVRQIDDRGGSTGINLREIAKAIGCAHTNAYNYYEGFEGLLWAAFEEALRIYSGIISEGLNRDLSSHSYYSRVLMNMLNFAEKHPGLYIFISTDPLPTETVPDHLVVLLTKMKSFIFDMIHQVSAGRLTAGKSQEVAEIILAYMDGETLNLVNGRFLPGDDIAERIVKNAVHLFTLLTSRNNDGVVLSKGAANKEGIEYPV